MPEHKNISDPEIHEPKGASVQTAGKVYITDGGGSGNWVDTDSLSTHNTIAYADKTLVGDGVTGVDYAIPAAGDPTLRTLDDYTHITNAFTPDTSKGVGIDADGNFVISTSGIYQFNIWMSEENTMSKQTLGVTTYRNQADANNLTGPVGGPVMRDKTKDLGGGEPSIDDLVISGIIELAANDVIGLAVACVGAGTLTIFDGSMSLILLEDLT